MAASRLDRFSWARANVVIETNLPEWEGRTETKTLDDVRVVSSVLRRQGWHVRAIVNHTGEVLEQLAVESSAMERGRAVCVGPLPGGGQETWYVERREDCGCG